MFISCSSLKKMMTNNHQPTSWYKPIYTPKQCVLHSYSADYQDTKQNRIYLEIQIFLSQPNVKEKTIVAENQLTLPRSKGRTRQMAAVEKQTEFMYSINNLSSEISWKLICGKEPFYFQQFSNTIQTQDAIMHQGHKFQFKSLITQCTCFNEHSKS